MTMSLTSKEPRQRVEIRINDRFSLSIIQGFGTYSTANTVEVAVLDFDIPGELFVREPRPEVTGTELAVMIQALLTESRGN